MWRTIEQIADEHFLNKEEFVKFADLNSNKFNLFIPNESSAPSKFETHTWFVDDMIYSFLKSGGSKLTKEEIFEKRKIK